MPPRLVILSEPTVASYGAIGELYRATFERMGIAASLRPYPVGRRPQVPRGAIVLHNTLGFRFTPMAGAVNIAVPFHEWSRYPAEWAARLNRFDAVWAASDHVRRTLRRSGVTAPIRMAPPALDLHPPPPKHRWSAERPFRFLFIGEPHFRKGHHLLIQGFRRLSGRRAATLTIKTSPGCAWRVPDRNIHLVRASWPRRKLLELYRSHDAFVSASLGEGLGLGVAEAMLAGLPVAANRWGGHRSLLAPGAFTPIRHRVVLQPFCSVPEFFAPGQQCAFSSPEHVAAAMERLMNLSAAERRTQAERAQAVVRERFGLDAVAPRLRAALDGADE